MNRMELTEKNNQSWYRGQAFSDNGCDPEFREIAQGFLCGDVTEHGTLSDVQKALIHARQRPSGAEAHPGLSLRLLLRGLLHQRNTGFENAGAYHLLCHLLPRRVRTPGQSPCRSQFKCGEHPSNADRCSYPMPAFYRVSPNTKRIGMSWLMSQSFLSEVIVNLIDGQCFSGLVSSVQFWGLLSSGISPDKIC